MKHKRNDPMCDPWDSQGNEKNAISISIDNFFEKRIVLVLTETTGTNETQLSDNSRQPTQSE